jgi:hypothetical protein
MNNVKLLVGLVLCLAIGAGLGIVYTNKKNAEAKERAESKKFNMVKVPQSAHRVLLEAAVATKIEKPFSLNDGSGKGCGSNAEKCLYLGPEKVNQSPETAQYSKGHPLAPHPGFARYEFTVPETDEYVFWLHAFWVDDCGNSVMVSIDGSEPLTLGGSTYGSWNWDVLRDNEGVPLHLSLKKDQTHTITLCNREDDLYIGQLMLLGSDRPWPVPVGIAK